MNLSGGPHFAEPDAECEDDTDGDDDLNDCRNQRSLHELEADEGDGEQLDNPPDISQSQAVRCLFGYDAGMSTSAVQLNEMIVDILTAGERRELSMVVAIRRRLNLAGTIKGDLAKLTKSGLRKLVAAGTVLERDGVYTLSAVASFE